MLIFYIYILHVIRYFEDTNHRDISMRNREKYPLQRIATAATFVATQLLQMLLLVRIPFESQY